MPVRNLSTRELDRSDINALLARSRIGRLAFTREGEIDVLPVHYVYSAGSIYGRTATGGKLRHLDPAGAPVAFQVDEIRSLHDGSSVLVHGLFQVLAPLVEHEEWLRAVGLLRRLSPDTLREGDPMPQRSEVFRILVNRATGRVLG